MDAVNGGDGSRSFRVDFSSEGVEMLRERVKEKLKEFMGDYTDDTLVEYVIVLLKNGRSKDEARSELNVFLDEDSDSFVSWLWDHLGSNLTLYVQAREPHGNQATKTKIGTVEQDGGNVSDNLEPESEKMKPKSSRSCHNRLWKGVVRDAVEQPRLRSSVAKSIPAEKERNHKVSQEKRSISPQLDANRKRKQLEEQTQNKREVLTQATVVAPRRLLQFAVRDAVATSRPSKFSRESSLKRLRSVVSAPVDDNIEEPHLRPQSVARVPVSMAAAIKAVAEAAKDVKRVRSSGNVFDRLGRASDILDSFDQIGELGEEIADEDEDRTLNDMTGYLGPSYDMRTDYAQSYPGKMSLLQSEPRMEVDYESHEEKYVRGERQGVVNTSQTGTSGQYKVMDLLVNQDDPPHKADEVRKNQDRVVAMFNTSHKLVSLSSNSNTWISPQYQETRTMGADSWKNTHANEAKVTTSTASMMENKSSVVSTNGTAKIDVSLQKESQMTKLSAPGLNSSSRPVEDADSRTIFVSNVHFAATKDSLLRHFNKFGEVLKVIILTDAATGQPKGSAYVEFMKREAADGALSLDGTSFMSRLLKVVRKNSAQPEASSVLALPRIARASSSPFTMSRYGRVPFPRGVPSMYRARLSMKPGARSLQWKRDSQSRSGALPSPASSTAARGLTYVRPEPKVNESTSAT